MAPANFTKPIVDKQQATLNALKNAQSIASRENDAQKAAITTMDQNQKAALVAQTAVNILGNVQQAAAAAVASVNAGVQTGAIRTGTANTAAATRQVAPPIVGALYSGFASLRATIWAARPQIQSTTVVNQYSTGQRTGTRSGSRNTYIRPNGIG